MARRRIPCWVLCGALLASVSAPGAVNEEPVAAWVFDEAHLQDGRFRAAAGALAARLEGAPRLVRDQGIEAAAFDGRRDSLLVADDLDAAVLPRRQITVEAWAVVFTPMTWGGIIGAVQDNGDSEQGWVLGFDEEAFYFGLASQGADDGDGAMTYLRADRPLQAGRWSHVVGVYDGAEMRLYLDGAPAGAARDQSGDLLYPAQACYAIAAYRDANEFHRFHGLLREVRVWDRALTGAQIAARARAYPGLAGTPTRYRPEVEILHGPYLQNATRESMTVKWETTAAADSVVEYGKRVPLERRAAVEGERTLHEVVLEGLEPETNYFYRIASHTADGRQTGSELFTFQTAVRPETAFSFVVLSDTQTNFNVSSRIAELAWRERPHLALHCGDLVGTGTVKLQWTTELFGPCAVLLGRVPLFAVPGNHDQNASWFYDYMANPGRENYYSFRFGNAYFAMIDSNQDVRPGSEQYEWLENDLAAHQDATWRFAAFHHPPYSSDENDYGNTWEGPSTHGDLDTRQLAPLFERYRVDLVFNGHIHNYERTWPLKEGRVNQAEGVVYVICGGAGGGLENWAPTPTGFAAKLVREHHFVRVALHHRSLRLECIDIEGRLRDTLEISKDGG